MRWRRRRQKTSESGIALFMVISAMAVIVPIVAEMTYSTEIHSRMAYNSLDNAKAYYMAKAAFKLSLVRLRAYTQIKAFIDKPDNKQIKEQLPKGVLDKVWSMPMMYPVPVPKEASMAETDAIKQFEKDSRLSGTFVATITGLGSKLNMNNLLLKEVPPDPAGTSGASGASGSSGSSGASGANPPAGSSGASGASGASASPMDFRPLMEDTVNSLLEQKKNEDKEFADIYRNIQGKDVIDAIEYYLKPDQPASALPGFKPFHAKLAPFYSITELHLIPGIDDAIYKLLESAFTVYSTPGINVNAINKRMLMSLFPIMTEAEADDVLRTRDDPDVGQPWGSEDEFYNAIAKTSAGRDIDALKKKFKAAGIKFLTEEKTFKVSVLANVGQSSRRLEAFINVDPSVINQSSTTGQNPQGQNPQGQQPQGQQPKGQSPNDPNGQQQDASAKKPTGVNLIYWRML